MRPFFTAALTFILSSAILIGCSKETSRPTESWPSSAQNGDPKTQISEPLQKAVKAYHEFGLQQTDLFVQKTEAFVAAVKSGDIEQSKQLYPHARMPFERIEPIAESMGELDPRIDARENDVPAEEWSGYHKIEKALWVENKTAGIEPYADQLLIDVKALRTKIELAEVLPLTLITGAVDLLNEVSSSKISGEEERYSHTDLYDFAANVQGAEKIFQLLRPIIADKKPQLADTLDQRFSDVQNALDQYKQGENYALYTELQDADTRKLSGLIDALAEPLSQLGIVMEN